MAPSAVAREAPVTPSATLTVVYGDGGPVASAVVRLSGVQATEQVTDADGVTVFTGLPAGEYTLQTSAGDMSHPRITFELAGTGSLELCATLRPVKEFAISGAIRNIGDYRFDDSIPGPTMAVEYGDMVRVVFSIPEGDIVHVFAIDEFGVTSPNVIRGESTIIEFVAEQKGQFSYYCPLPSHRALGMEGAFEVN